MKYIPYIFILVILSCSNSKQEKTKQKEIIYSARREAPLGWVILDLHPNNEFTFYNNGLRVINKYPGKYSLNKDTITLNFEDSLPTSRHGCNKAIISENFINFNGCLGSLETTKNKLALGEN